MQHLIIPIIVFLKCLFCCFCAKGWLTVAVLAHGNNNQRAERSSTRVSVHRCSKRSILTLEFGFCKHVCVETASQKADNSLSEWLKFHTPLFYWYRHSTYLFRSYIDFKWLFSIICWYFITFSYLCQGCFRKHLFHADLFCYAVSTSLLLLYLVCLSFFASMPIFGICSWRVQIILWM